MENYPDMAQLMRLAQSPAGQQLMALLRNSGGNALDQAVRQASAGDMAAAGNTLLSILNTPQAKALLKQLEDQK